ncbi:hypothetical protein PSYAC_26851 [Pseudomonas syringae pv. actinidiae str. M302091]|nr:hypothetical protein PSYAC_26851 [Pseudomonas syringae pv. actinidiae str. M302091]
MLARAKQPGVVGIASPLYVHGDSSLVTKRDQEVNFADQRDCSQGSSELHLRLNLNGTSEPEVIEETADG